MFRIMFEPKGGFFKVQFSCFFGLGWRNIKEPSPTVGENNALTVKKFRTYKEAREWCDGIGLGAGFDEQPTKGHPFRNGYGPRYANMQQ